MLGTGDVLEDLEDIVSGNSSSVMDMSTVTTNMQSFLQVGTALFFNLKLFLKNIIICKDKYFFI